MPAQGLTSVRLLDRELPFTAAMLHDIGLAGPPQHVDLTLASARAARDVA